MFAGFFIRILTNWRVWLGIAVLAGAGFLVYKYRELEKQLAQSEQAVKVEQANNVVLRNSVTQLGQINASNAAIIAQQQKDQATVAESLDKLSRDISKSGKAFGEVATKINGITVAPTKLTPYLKEAIKGIQEQRDLLGITPQNTAPQAAPRGQP